MDITRNFIMLLTRIPPRFMFLAIVGLALVTTWLVTGEMDKRQREMQTKIADLQRQKEVPPKVVFVDKPTAPVAQPQPEFQALLKPGYRAVSVPVDMSNGSTRFISSGSHVDVMDIVGSGKDIDAVPILSDVEVVAVGSSFQKGTPSPEAAGSVTLAVSPQDAARLLKAQAAGKIFLTLRSDKDHMPLPVTDPLKVKPRPTPVIVSPSPQVIFPPVPVVHERQTVKSPAGSQVEVWAGNRRDVVSFTKETH